MALALAATTSCSNYLDINEDPNSPSSDNITASILMPNAELNLANAYGNMLRIQGGYLSEHYAQEFGTSNYLDYSQFNVSPTNSDRPYNVLYDGAIKNLTSIQQKARASSDWGSYGDHHAQGICLSDTCRYVWQLSLHRGHRRQQHLS